MADVKAALEQRDRRAKAETRPSIAVLPFANMSADKENEYFSDGLAEEIINALAHIPGAQGHRADVCICVPRQGTGHSYRLPRRSMCGAILEGSVRRVRQPSSRDRSAHQRRGRLSTLVGTLRPRDGRCVRDSGRDCAGDCCGSSCHAHSGPPNVATTYRESRRLRGVPEGAILPMEAAARVRRTQQGVLRGGAETRSQARVSTRGTRSLLPRARGLLGDDDTRRNAEGARRRAECLEHRSVAARGARAC